MAPTNQKEKLKTEDINQEIYQLSNSFRNFDDEKRNYLYKSTHLQEKASNFWLRFFLGFFSFFLSFLGYTTKEDAIRNKKMNQENHSWNQKHKIEVDQTNKKVLKEIEKFNQKIQSKIDALEQKFSEIKNHQFELISNDDEDLI